MVTAVFFKFTRVIFQGTYWVYFEYDSIHFTSILSEIWRVEAQKARHVKYSMQLWYRTHLSYIKWVVHQHFHFRTLPQPFIKHSISYKDATNHNVTLCCAHVVKAFLSRGSWQRFRPGIIDSKIIVSPSKAELTKSFSLTPSKTSLYYSGV